MTSSIKTLALMGAAVLALAACSKKPDAAPAGANVPPAAGATAGQAALAAQSTAPAGDYALDKAHGSLTFRIGHLGFSRFTGRFEKWDAKLKFDPKTPTAMTVEATIDPKSIAHDNPPEGFLAELAGSEFLDAGKYPQMTFKSTKVVTTGANTADVTGDLTLHGVTKPVVLHVTFNGGYAGMGPDAEGRIGFSATAALKRSDFGVSFGLPAAGTNVGVSDTVDVDIESEFKAVGAKAP